jgi:hypothetical protein
MRTVLPRAYVEEGMLIKADRSVIPELRYRSKVWIITSLGRGFSWHKADRFQRRRKQ